MIFKHYKIMILRLCYAQSLPSEPIFQLGNSHMKQFVGSTIICVIKYILGGGQEEQLGTSKISPGTGQMLFLQEKQTDTGMVMNEICAG